VRKLLETKNFDEEFAHFRAMRVWKRAHIVGTYVPPDMSALTGEARENALKNAEAREQKIFLTELLSLAHKIESEVCDSLEALPHQILTLADRKACVQKMSFNALKEELEGLRSEIKRIPQVCKDLDYNYLRPDVAAASEKGKSFLIKIGEETQPFTIYREDLDAFQAQIHEKIEVLHEAEKFYQEVAAVYDAELKTRVTQSSEVIKLAVKEANAIIKEAEKLSKTITQAAEKCKTAGFTDLEAVEKFVSAMDRFEEIEREYSTIGPKIAKVVRTEDVAKTLPSFPIAPKCGFDFNLDSKIRSFRNQREYALLNARKELRRR